MINSMTGYGEAQGESHGISYAVTIKTVNNRYFKAAIKLPELAAFLEEDIEKLLRKNISRGTVNYVLRLKEAPVDVLFDIDEAALQAVAEKLNRVGSTAGIEGTIELGNLLNLPGVIRPATPDEEQVEQIRNVILRISQEALDKLKHMRAVEGGFLEADLKKHCGTIENDLGQINARSPVVMQRYTEKLKKRVNELLANAELKLDEESLVREVAIFADRSDISEEVARLDSHLKQFEQCCQGNDQAGRRLDFISQEMLREANTIASKASDTEITRFVVDIKCQIDRIKEQVQNVE
ncbi:MAG: YicC family protein [Sedimentisphaerales bacterium]|nr:YicC family protein [Sedimentisphaerales bacterium]